MSYVAIDRALWSDLLEAVQSKEDEELDVPEHLRSKRWENVRKRLVASLAESAEREFAEEPPALLRRQA